MADEANENLLYWDAHGRPQRLPPSAIVDEWPVDHESCGIPPLLFRDGNYRTAYRLIQAEFALGVVLDASGKPGLKEVRWILVYEGPLGILGRKTVPDYGLMMPSRWAEDLLNLIGKRVPDELKQYGVPARAAVSAVANIDPQRTVGDAAGTGQAVVSNAVPPLLVPDGDPPNVKPAALANGESKPLAHWEAVVSEYLAKNPDAKSPEIVEKTGVPDGTIRKLNAWKKRHEAEKPALADDAMDRRRSLSTAMEAVMAGKSEDPVEAAEFREAEDLLKRIERDNGYRDDVQSQYLDDADAAQRDEYRKATRNHQVEMLVSWKLGGVRQ